MKKILAGALAAALFCVPVSLQVSAHPPVTVLVDGRALTFDQPPVIQDDRTLVPMRAIFQALGAQVYWDESTQTVTALAAQDTLQFRIGDAGLYKNGQLAYTMAVPAQIINERTLVPVRAIAESFGAAVGWDEPSYTVTIQSQNGGQALQPDQPSQPVQPEENTGTQTVQSEPKPGGFTAEVCAADGTTVLTVKLECELLEQKKSTAETINMSMAEATFAEGQGFLREYSGAALKAYAAQPNNFQPYFYLGSYRLTRNDGDYTSFWGAADSFTGTTEKKLCSSHTFSLTSGKETTMGELFPDSQSELEEVFRSGFQAMIKEKPAEFYRDAETRLERQLGNVGFYLTKDGAAFYLPPESIAPADAGLISFEITYDVP